MPAPAPKQEYQRAEVRRMLRVSERQLQAWQHAGLVRQAETYSFRDLSALRTIRDLRARRIPLRVIGRALESLKTILGGVHDPLAELKVFSDGRRITVRVAGQNMEALTGQILLDFDPSQPASVRALPAHTPRLPQQHQSEAWFQKGLFLEETGAPVEQVVEAYQKAIECNPQAAGALVNLGTIYYRLARYKDAEAYYTRALASDPNYPLAHFNLGNLHDEWGDTTRAQQCYEAALKANPRYGDAHFNLALLCERRGDSLKAVHHWKSYLKVDSTSEWADIARRQLEKLRVALLS